MCVYVCVRAGRRGVYIYVRLCVCKSRQEGCIYMCVYVCVRAGRRGVYMCVYVCGQAGKRGICVCVEGRYM